MYVKTAKAPAKKAPAQPVVLWVRGKSRGEVIYGGY